MNNQSSIEPFADFHALRHSFYTHVIKSGATVKEAQTLARHSTSALTMEVYSHIGLYDIRRAVERLPQSNIDGKDTNESQAATLKTGTDNKPVDAVQNGSEKLTPKLTPFLTLTPTDYSGCNWPATVGNKLEDNRKSDEDSKSLTDRLLNSKQVQISLSVTGQKLQAAAGFEPANNGFANRRLRPLGYAAKFKIPAYFTGNWLVLQ